MLKRGVDMYNFKFVYYPNGELKVVNYKKPICFGDEKKEKKEGLGCTPDEIINSSLTRTKNMIIDYARANIWEWFITFTFDKEKVDRYDYDEVSKKFSQWLKNMKKKYLDMKYIVVPELHKDGAFHFHGLFSSELEKSEAINGKGKNIKDTQGRQVYNLIEYKLGFSTSTRVTDTKKASNYILKYITKELCLRTPNKRRYWHSRNLELPYIEKIYIKSEKAQLELIKSIEKRTNFVRKVSPLSYPEQEITYYEINTNTEIIPNKTL